MWSNAGEMPEFPVEQTLVLNTANPLVQRLASMEQNDESRAFCQELKDLAELTLQPLSAERMSAFLQRTQQLLSHMG